MIPRKNESFKSQVRWEYSWSCTYCMGNRFPCLPSPGSGTDLHPKPSAPMKTWKEVQKAENGDLENGYEGGYPAAAEPQVSRLIRNIVPQLL